VSTACAVKARHREGGSETARAAFGHRQTSAEVYYGHMPALHYASSSCAEAYHWGYRMGAPAPAPFAPEPQPTIMQRRCWCRALLGPAATTCKTNQPFPHLVPISCCKVKQRPPLRVLQARHARVFHQSCFQLISKAQLSSYECSRGSGRGSREPGPCCDCLAACCQLHAGTTSTRAAAA
jgi:hypothetical protein